jgi:hypothetical protein
MSGPIVAHFEARARPAPAPALDAAAVATLVANADVAVASTLASARVALATELGLTSNSRWFVHDGALVFEHTDSNPTVPHLIDGRHGAPVAMPLGADRFGASRDLALGAVPLAHRLMLGQTVRVFDEQREVCVATVSSLSLEAHLTHIPESNWDDEGNPLEPTPLAYTPSEIFDNGVVLLKGQLVPLFGTCEGGLWATPVDAPSPTLYREADAPDRSLTQRAIGAFRKTSVYTAIQKRYLDQFSADYPAPAPRWDILDGRRPEVRRFVGDNGDVLVAVTADTMDGCGSPGQSGLAVFRLTGTRLDFVTGSASGAVPTAFIDLEKDGHPEAIFADAHMKRSVRWSVTPSQPLAADDFESDEALDTLYIPDLTNYGCGC